MVTLVLDTCHRYLACAIYEDDQCLAKYQNIGAGRQSEDAVLEIQELLEKAHYKLPDVKRVIVSRGPGSYTGVRVGLTIAKTLKVIHPEVEVIPVSSLMALAGLKEKVISVLDARSRKAYIGIYDGGKTVLAECLVPVENLESLKKAYPDYTWAGDCELADEPLWTVDLCANLYALGQHQSGVSLHELLPVYIKEVEAKQQWFESPN